MFDIDIIRNHHLAFRSGIINEDLLFCIEYSSKMMGDCIQSDAQLYHYRIIPTSAVNRRYVQGTPLSKAQITEKESLDACVPYLFDDPSVKSAHLQRTVRAAGADVRTLVAHEQKDQEYKESLAFLRRNLWHFLFGEMGSRSAKLSVLLSAISPKLEWKIWTASVLKGMK